MRKLAVAFVVLVMTGCANVSESYAPDGRRAYELNCSGMSRSWDTCFSQAERLCKAAGYDILRKSDESPRPIGGGAGGLHGSLADERSMLIACKVGQ